MQERQLDLWNTRILQFKHLPTKDKARLIFYPQTPYIKDQNHYDTGASVSKQHSVLIFVYKNGKMTAVYKSTFLSS